MLIKYSTRRLELILIVLFSIYFLGAQQVELVTTFEGETRMGVTIKTSHPIEAIETLSQSPPVLKILFPGMEFKQTKYSKHISLPPLYKIEAKMVGIKKKSTEVTLYFTTLPDYQIEADGDLITRVTWTPKKEAVERRRIARRISMFETTVSLHFKNAEIIDILRLLQVQNNLNIVSGEDVKGKVTVSLNDVNLGTALDAILKVNGYDWFMQENIVVIKPIDEDMTGELETRLYKLDYIDANALASALTNVLTDKGKIQVFSPVSKSGGRGVGTRAGGGSTGGGGLLGALGGGVSPIAGAGQGIGAITGGGAGARGSAVPGMDHLIVTDNHYNFDRIEVLIHQMDKQIAQINISVKFIETTLTLDEQLGINWNLRATLLGPSANNTSGGIDIGRLPEAIGKNLRIATLSVPLFTALLNILSADNSTRIIQEPQTTTQDNTLAILTSGTTYPIIIPQTEGSAFGNQPVTFRDQEVNVTLSILPRINEGRFITMNIQATVDAVVGFVGPNADRPVISTRSTKTQVTVPNGETLLIGGMIIDQKTETGSSVPILSSLPYIGRIFSSKIVKIEQRELLIFITPNIINLK